MRPTAVADIGLLPAVERSSAQSFRAVPDLAWIADDPVMSEAQHRHYVDAGTSWVAAPAGAEPVGFLCAEAFAEELHVQELAVRADWQRRGLGRQLLEAAIGHARGRHLAAVTLTTFREVPWNEPFYRSAGFVTLTEPGERLGAVLALEAGRGLPRRCAMRFNLA